MKALFFILLCAIPAAAEPVAVVHPEGSLHGFVKLSRLDGKRLADGELT